MIKLKMSKERKMVNVNSKMKGMLTIIKKKEKELKQLEKSNKEKITKEGKEKIKKCYDEYLIIVKSFVNYWNKKASNM